MISELQFGFMPRKITTEPMFAFRVLMEMCRDGQKDLHCLCKPRESILREELWYCIRMSGVAEKYVRMVQDVYENRQQ